MKAFTRRSMQLLRLLYEKEKASTTYTLTITQNELAKQLDINRQVLNIHLRKLKELNVERVYRITGDVDAQIIIEREKLNDLLVRLVDVEGVPDTRSYIPIETIK